MTKKEKEKWLKGYHIAHVLNLKQMKHGSASQRFDTTWGTKAALGLYETVKRIVNKELMVEATQFNIDDNGRLTEITQL